MLNTSQILKLLALLLAAFPTTYVFFKVLQSSALVTRKGAVIGGAAAGFLIAFLVNGRTLEQLSQPDPEVSREILSGIWEVFNEEEPDLYAVWSFEESAKIPGLTARGTVWKGLINNLLNPRMRQALMQFGPHEIRARDANSYFFDYTSPLGSGRAELALTFGFVGKYFDDPKATPSGQADHGALALSRKTIDREGTRLRWILQASLATIGLSWITTLLAYVLFRWFKSTAVVRWKGVELAGPFAFYYVFFLVCSGFLDLKPNPVGTFDMDLLPGTWKLEYLDDRSRYAEVTIHEAEDGKLHLRGDLFRRTDVPPIPGGFRATFEGSDLRYDASSHEFSFSYSSPAGVGVARFSFVPAIVGYFLDRENQASEEINSGTLLGLKRLN